MTSHRPRGGSRKRSGSTNRIPGGWREQRASGMLGGRGRGRDMVTRGIKAINIRTADFPNSSFADNNY